MNNALYRKYRPKKFSQILGQSNIVSILEKTVELDNPVHAYLFSGSKGTGKTSTARVFANSLGCNDTDIFEIDAASSNSVEDINNINDRVKHMPMSSKYSIYILDEVHMLSKAAFNAFLKTLEEPPKHVIFILATTEIQKLPETIYSRCQQHIFSRPNLDIIEKAVIDVAKTEGYILQKASAYIIAIISEGSLRDAYGNLQKVLLSANSKKIEHENVESILGVPKHEAVNIYIETLVRINVKKGIDILDSCKNINFELFTDLVLLKLRVIILFKSTQDISLLDEFLDNDKKFIKDISEMDGISLDLLKEIITARLAIKNSYIKKLPLEMLLVSRSYSQKDSS